MHPAVKKIYLHAVNGGKCELMPKWDGDSSIRYRLIGSQVFGLAWSNVEQVATLEPIGKLGK